MSGKWKIRKHKHDSAKGSTPMVSLEPTPLLIEEIHFATKDTGRSDFHYIYQNSNTHPKAPGDMQWWARGSKITTPEWGDSGKRNLPACFTRNAPIAMAVKLVATTSKDLMDYLMVTPKLKGVTSALEPTVVTFSYPANAKALWVNVVTQGALPDEIGSYELELKWETIGRTFKFKGPKETRHRIYSIYGQPFDPDYDSAKVKDDGTKTTPDEGTLTGTPRRLNHMMSLIGGRDKRHRVTTEEDLIDLYWELHRGINDTPGAPPYFSGANDVHITTEIVNPDAGATTIHVADQWLAWVRTPAVEIFFENPNPQLPPLKVIRHWNDCSCIGHAQVAKTMLAAVGLFARRAWVFPKTAFLPDGTVNLPTDLYSLGVFDSSKMQTWTFKWGGVDYKASPKLMEPNYAWENYEACLLSPSGKFLTGGYSTKANPEGFRANKGFDSAQELLHWWCNTSRKGFGKRFLCWVWQNTNTKETHLWDVDGKHYDLKDYVEIRERGKALRPLEGPPK